MAAYGASRGELNRDGNQGSATDDYLATPDQRFPSVSSQEDKEKIISPRTMKLPVPVLLSHAVKCSRAVNI